ncbi:MAG: hybrid sensor histidine kinase/response regulator [Candidatus Promineifilaceae bacterium]
MFKLQRYFSLTSFIAFIFVLVGLSYFYSWSATNSLFRSAEEHNIILGQVFSNTLWSTYGDFIASSSGLDRKELMVRLETQQLQQTFIEQTNGTNVVKIKIYNLEGITVFSSEEDQIGEDQSANLGFVAACGGEVVSELNHRDQFSAFDQTISDRDLVSSYVPIQYAGGEIEGVLEIYSDLTPLLEDVNQARIQVVMGVAGGLGLLYLILFVIVNHADRILRREVAERNLAETALQLERANLATQVAEQTSGLRQMNEQLVDASKLKDQFLAMMSHELRTPLTTVLARSDALRLGVYGALSQPQDKAVSGIQAGGKHLLSLVSDLLDVSVTETDKLKIDKKPVEIHKLCQTSLKAIQAIAQKKDLRISLTLGSRGMVLEGDERRLRQILISLLHNAAKFTPEQGLIGLDVKNDVLNQTVTLTVWDTGIGISEEDQARIFIPFTQADGRLSREFEGAGLGLALVDRFTKLHGGHVDLQSTVGQGSRFSIVLPWVPGNVVVLGEVEGVSAEIPQPELDFSPLILIAEDNNLNAETLTDTLEYSGFRTSRAVNGLEAIDKARAQQPDLILMDVQMPKLNGLDAIRKIRSEVSHHIPIIVVTGFTRSNDRQTCLDAGADGFMSKPVSLERLADIVARHLESDEVLINTNIIA